MGTAGLASLPYCRRPDAADRSEPSSPRLKRCTSLLKMGTPMDGGMRSCDSPLNA
jgi:hypothetical protein